MIEQVSQRRIGSTDPNDLVYRWRLVANGGRETFTTWAPTADAARAKALRRAEIVSVESVQPAGPPEMP